MTIRNAIVPPDDVTPDLGEPTRDGGGLQLSWTFDSHLGRAAYLDWVTTRLADQGFSIVHHDAIGLAATRVDGGDAYRLRIEPSLDSPSHVRATVRASPD